MPTVRSAKQPAKGQVIGFGFNPENSAHHLLVTIPAGNRPEVLIASSA
jgi:hypothetical protein